ncbi:MAG: RNA polymerase sigma factor RpoD [bacterium ADurb.BinA186]|nr:MAG: RNA polymerase sigma factor RpoD [bacterium ADurb.BinA186]
MCPKTDEDFLSEEENDEITSSKMSSAVKKLLAKGKARGYVTADEINLALPQDKETSEFIEDIMSTISDMGINVIDSVEEDDEEGDEVALVDSGDLIAATGKTDDPVRMYLREMGAVDLLSREGEVAIAKRMEAGNNLMIGSLCESPLTMRALSMWHNDLVAGKMLLREIIDLDATYDSDAFSSDTKSKDDEEVKDLKEEKEEIVEDLPKEKKKRGRKKKQKYLNKRI